MPANSRLQANLQKSRNATASTPPHLIVEARAGTGKTTTLVSGLQVLKGMAPTDAKGRPITPSTQQKAVWDSIALSKGVRTVAFVAFNKSIATELQARVPQGCDASTMHSMGYKAVLRAYPGLKVESYRVSNLISEVLEVDIRALRKSEAVVVTAVEELVALVKQNLSDRTEDGWLAADDTESWNEVLAELASYYEVELDKYQERVFSLVPQVIERCRDLRDRTVDFNDMIWLPVALGLPVFQYDLLLVDEAQDLNRCQQALARKAGKRLILCGDPRQAIYGFAGADPDSMPRMAAELATTPAGCVTLPLTVTRRCGRAIVAEANKVVADFQAHESNPDGVVDTAAYPSRTEGKETPWEQTYCGQVKPGDFVICRVNAPLVGQCFRFLRRGIKATIQGRDVGRGLISTIKKLKATSITSLVEKLDDWYQGELQKEQAKRNPSEAKIISLGDRVDCLYAFMEGAETVDQVIQKIESVFTDNKNEPGVRFSSIHRAKGLESHTVFFLMPKEGSCPHPMARSQWQREQEMNLLYVGVTRAIDRLVFVR